MVDGMLGTIGAKLVLKRLALLGLILSLCGFIRGTQTPPGNPTFNPAWQPMLLGDGGNARGVHVQPSGDILGFTDTYGGYLYKPSGPCSLGNASLTTPCWQELVSTSSINSSLWAGIFGTTPGVSDMTQCAANINVLYMIFTSAVYVSSDKGTSWTKTNMTTDLVGANGGATQSNWIACDPNDANGNIAYVQTVSSGLYKTSTGTAGTGWAHVTSPPASATSNGGSIFYDPTSSVSGGVTQHFYVTSNGIGVYETTNGGTSFTLLNSAGMPTATEVLAVDKFGQVWVSPGFYGANHTLYRYASGAWTTFSSLGTNINQALAIVFDPNTGASSGANHVIIVDANGYLGVTLDNGGTWTAVTTATFTSSAPQATWLGTASQFQGGGSLIALNVNGGSIDATGKIWIAGGISIWTTPNPISGCPGACTIAGSNVWNANSIGIEQLVVNKVMAAPGQSPITSSWDRGVTFNPNPDAFATVQLTQDPAITLNDSFGIDYAPNKANVAVAQLTSESSVSTDGGNTWSQWSAFPTGMGVAGVVAVNTDQKWCSVPGNSTTPSGTIYCTNNGAGSWSLATVPGTPTFIQVNQKLHRQPLAADKVTSGVFYAVDTAFNFYKSNTSFPPTLSVVGTAADVDGNPGADKLQAVPGQAGHVFFASHPSNGGHLWKNTNGGATGSWTKLNSGMDQIPAYGFGAIKPGQSYPAIYAYGSVSSAFGFWASTDGGTTWALLNVPAAQQNWPLGSFDYPMGWLTGDADIYGRVYVGFQGSGVAYIDTADACPWINFDQVSVKPGSALTGAAVTLTARHTGLVPVTGVGFYLDGVQIGATQTGQTTYSVSLNASGQTPGAHTLKVQAAGNGCTLGGTGNSKSIPITTSANDNDPMWKLAGVA